MAVRFAGSKNLDTRRRRRIAGAEAAFAAAPANGSDPAAISTTGNAGEDRFRETCGTARAASEFPARKLISSRVWKHAVIGVALFVFAAVVFLVRHELLPTAALENLHRWIPANVLQPFADRTQTYFDSAVLMLSGQLCLLTWWVRSLSPRDFRGRYKIWAWAAGTCFVAGAAIATGVSAALRAILLNFVGPSMQPNVDWFWQLPAVLFAGSVVLGVLRDIHSDRTGLRMLQAALIAYILATMASHWRVFSEDMIRILSEGFATAAHVGLLTALLLHTRFVIHVDNDPPQPIPENAGGNRHAETVNGISDTDADARGAAKAVTEDAAAESSVASPQTRVA